MKLTDDAFASHRLVLGMSRAGYDALKAKHYRTLQTLGVKATELAWRRGEIKRPLTGFFAGLTPDQQAAALAYDGPEDFGDPDGPKAALSPTSNEKE